MTLQRNFQDRSPRTTIAPEEGVTMLFEAVNGDDICLVRQLIAAGVPVDARNKFGDTPLILAVHRGYMNMAREVLALQADPNAVNNDGFNPLYYAVQHNVAAMEMLFDKGARVPAGLAPRVAACLTAAVMGGFGKVVEAALAAGADPNAVVPDCDDARLLHIAGQNGLSKIVSSLIKAGANINATDKNQRSVLRAAMESDDTDSVMALLDAGADTHNRSMDQKSGRSVTDESFAVNCNFDVATAVMEASNKFNMIEKAAEGDANAVRDMLAQGIPANVFDRFGKTALINACEKDRADVVQVLVDHDADINLRAKNGDLPIHAAVCNDAAEIVRILCDAGASVFDKDSSGMSPADFVRVNPQATGVSPATKDIVWRFRDIETGKMAQNATRLDKDLSTMKALRFRPRASVRS